jgi:glycosyltransferase involved in cell wall biosynthesis
VRPASIQIDLTCYLRGPFTGVGLSAYRSFLALRELEDPPDVEAVCRRRMPGTPIPIRKLGLWERWRGRPGGIFHSFETSSPLVERSRRVLTVHDVWTLHPNRYQDPEFQQRQGAKLAGAIQRADRIITPSRATRDELLRWSPSCSAIVEVIPWAPILDPDRHGRDEDHRPEVERFLDERRPYFLTVAALEHRKNLPLLLQALRGVRGFDLVVVGAPGYGAESVLAEMNRSRDSGTRVLQLQKVPEPLLIRLYQEAMGLVLPSREEGFGMPVVEAMRFGIPLVLSEISAFRELAGEAAVYFSPDGTPGALRERLEALAGNAREREALSKLSLRRSEEFSWRKTAEALRSVYRGLEF